MHETTTCFDVSVTDRIAHVRMIRPERANSMIPAFWTELPQVIGKLSDEGKARVIVISAEGRHFCSGMDTTVFTGQGGIASDSGTGADGRPISHGRRSANFRLMALNAQETMNALERARMPIIAAVQGACVGGGVDMISACDMRYATADAFFCIQEINIGMTADVGTLQRLPKLVPPGIVAELAYTGRRMPAARAKEVGLVNDVYTDHAAMMEAVMGVAADIASKSPLAVLGTKQMMLYTRDHTVADGLEYIATWNASMLDPADMAEAFTAQIEKRAPEYPDLHPVRRGLGH